MDPLGGTHERAVHATAEELGVTRQEVQRASHLASIAPEAKEAARKAGPAAALSAKAGDKVSLYDISDGATWANKAELRHPWPERPPLFDLL